MPPELDTAAVLTPSANDATPVSAPVVEVSPSVPAAPVSAEVSAPAPAISPDAQPAAIAEAPLPATAAAEPERTSLLSEAGKPAEAAPAPAEVKPEEKKEAAEGEAPAEPAPPEPIVYDLKLPETVKLSEAETKEIQELLNEGRAAPEYAQKLIDRHYAEVDKVAKALRDEQWSIWSQTQEDWRGQVMADPELGGNRLQTTLNTAGAIIEQYGSEDLRRMLGYTGAGNHPAMVRFLYNVGRALGEGTMRPAPSPVPQAVKSRADRLYGNTKLNGA